MNITNPDPFGIVESFTKAYRSWMAHMPDFLAELADLNKQLQERAEEEHQRLQNEKKSVPVDSSSALIDFVRQYGLSANKFHGVLSSWVKDLIDKTPDIENEDRQRALFWASQLMSALAPSNYFWTNPGAVQRFIKSEGESLAQGFSHFLEDLKRGDNLLKLVDDSAFKIGENLAVTPGHVVFRNELVELIQYSPVTEKVYSVPVVFIQPWINKFYIFDLTPQNSFVQFMLEKGFTVFITSWKNPQESMRGIRFEDYLFNGILASIQAARDICGADQVHAAGYCIGGTALASLMAWLNQSEKHGMPVMDWSMFASLADFSSPGNLSLFTKESSIEALEKLMEKDGFLDAKYIGFTFRLLNSDSLIWRYVANNYLFGENPPKSDMLYWNCDSTRLPEAMCSFYLRQFYLHNSLAQKDKMKIGEVPVSLESIRQPLYVVGGQQDHISPWKSTFRTCSLVGCPVRYVLANEGHITGIVNPPSPRSKKKFWAGDVSPDIDPDHWLEQQQEQPNTWWNDWVHWLKQRSGEMITPPKTGSKKFPILDPAPGIYVFEK